MIQAGFNPPPRRSLQTCRIEKKRKLAGNPIHSKSAGFAANQQNIATTDSKFEQNIDVEEHTNRFTALRNMM